MKYVIVPTTRNRKALYLKKKILSIKTDRPNNQLYYWRCKFYHDPNFSCKVLIKSNDEIVISINIQHEAHPIVT